MIDLQAAKQLVLDHYVSVDAGKGLRHFVSPDYCWRGMHPFHTLHGAASVEEQFWRPVHQSFQALQRRPDIFFAGTNGVDGHHSVWVVQMGHLLGLFDTPWLGLRPTRKMAYLRYAEFHRIENGVIAETASYFDLLSLVQQAGLNPLPRQTGAQLITPGPMTHDGLLFDGQDAGASSKTLGLIDAMIDDLIGGDLQSPEDHMQRFWTPDMNWFGPGGIGASSGFEGYRRGHAQPFEEGLEFIRHNGHQCRVAESTYGGFFGYPSMTLRNRGYLGLTANSVEADMRIVDLYRRDGDKLAENWVFIDLLHFLNMQGYDVLERARLMG